MSGIDVDERQVEYRRLGVDRHALARAERRRAADMIAGMPVGRLRRARLHRLDAAHARKVLRGYLGSSRLFKSRLYSTFKAALQHLIAYRSCINIGRCGN